MTEDDRWLELIHYEYDDEMLHYVHVSLGLCNDKNETIEDYGFHIEYLNEVSVSDSITESIENNFFELLKFGSVAIEVSESVDNFRNLFYKFNWN